MLEGLERRVQERGEWQSGPMNALFHDDQTQDTWIEATCASPPVRGVRIRCEYRRSNGQTFFHWKLHNFSRYPVRVTVTGCTDGPDVAFDLAPFAKRKVWYFSKKALCSGQEATLKVRRTD
jgi:hypothetical protein